MSCIFAIDRHGKTGQPIITARWSDRAAFKADPRSGVVKANGFRWYGAGGFWYTTNLHKGRSVAAAYGATLPDTPPVASPIRWTSRPESATPAVRTVPTPTPAKTREFAPQSHVGQAIREVENRGKSDSECLTDILRAVAAAKSRQRRTLKIDDILAAMTR